MSGTGAARWEVVIGLETHAQLTTASKIFSGASTAFGASPNTQASAVDLALPGTLPVLNRGAVERAIRFGLAVGGDHRADERVRAQELFLSRPSQGLPDHPVRDPGGRKAASSRSCWATREKTVRLTRAHLEEDAGKSLHEDFHGMTGIDLNRAGTPLLEIVTEPDMRSAEEAVAYARTLHALVRWIGICDGNMQEGTFRCDANVSVRRMGDDTLGTRCEIKNLNSFRFLERAIEYEVRRQVELIEDGGKVVQETRLYDPDRGETRPMRTKEDAQDYRYFPDPDLLPLEIDAGVDRARAGGACPSCRRRCASASSPSTGCRCTTPRRSPSRARSADYFEAASPRSASDAAGAKLVANWMQGELAAALHRAELDFACVAGDGCAARARWSRASRDGTLSGKMAKDVFDALWAGEGERRRGHRRARGLHADLGHRRAGEGGRRGDRRESRHRRRLARRQGKGFQRAGRQGDGGDARQGKSRRSERNPETQAGRLSRSAHYCAIRANSRTAGARLPP